MVVAPPCSRTRGCDCLACLRRVRVPDVLARSMQRRMQYPCGPSCDPSGAAGVGRPRSCSLIQAAGSARCRLAWQSTRTFSRPRDQGCAQCIPGPGGTRGRRAGRVPQGVRAHGRGRAEAVGRGEPGHRHAGALRAGLPILRQGQADRGRAAGRHASIVPDTAPERGPG